MSNEDVEPRLIGNFAPTSPPNDWAHHYLGITGCCTGNGNRARYHIWENILHEDGGKLRVNMLLNRGSKWADVDSHVPYTGQVDIKAKEPIDLSIRIPQWVSAAQTRVTVNGADRNARINGRYAEVGDVKPGDIATTTFPIGERLSAQWVQGDQYNLVLKGTDVVAIDPTGTIALYSYATTTVRTGRVGVRSSGSSQTRSSTTSSGRDRGQLFVHHGVSLSQACSQLYGRGSDGPRLGNG